MRESTIETRYPMSLVVVLLFLWRRRYWSTSLFVSATHRREQAKRAKAKQDAMHGV